MRVIAIKTLKDYLQEFHQAEHALLSWHEEAVSVSWSNPNELKAQYKNASILNENRVVFNIHGNRYRLIIDIQYRLKIDVVVWLGRLGARLEEISLNRLIGFKALLLSLKRPYNP